MQYQCTTLCQYMCVLRPPKTSHLVTTVYKDNAAMQYVYGSTMKVKINCHWLVSCSLPPISIMDKIVQGPLPSLVSIRALLVKEPNTSCMSLKLAMNLNTNSDN